MDKINNSENTSTFLNANIGNVVEYLRELEPQEYTDENFYTFSNEKRFFLYLRKVLLSKSDCKDFSKSIVQRKAYYRPFESKTIITPKGVISIVPELERLRDEMSCIHEYTHLLNYKNNPKNQDSIYKNIIPTFNEYDYLKQIGNFYANYYRRLVSNNAIEAAKRMDETNQKDCLSHILAYLVLEHRRDNYNIDKLNEINCQSKKLENSLINKGYTF